MSNSLTFPRLVNSIVDAHRSLSAQAKLAVNISLTVRNWLIGAYIHEYELQGADRAVYGDKLIDSISSDLAKYKLSSVDRRQLYRYLDFYRTYPQIVGTLTPQSVSLLSGAHRLKQIVGTLSAQSPQSEHQTLLRRLSYSHLEALVKLDSPEKRRFYQEHCLKANWSVREVKRQIASLYFERTALSTNKGKLVKLTESATENRDPSTLISTTRSRVAQSMSWTHRREIIEFEVPEILPTLSAQSAEPTKEPTVKHSSTVHFGAAGR